MTALDRIFQNIRALIFPKARLRVSEWAELHAYLPAEGNAEPGKYHIARMPYQREMLDDAIDTECAESVWVIASQLGKTLCFVLIDCYFIGQDPSGILDVYPTLESAKAYRREKLDPTIKAIPVLRGKVRPPRSRDSNNTTLNFRFPGGNLTLCGANSPSGLRQRSKRVVKQDEIDAYESNSEGDPCTQADKRAETFHNAVKMKSSTPTFTETSRITKRYEKSDKQLWFCKCPKCGLAQALEWEQMRFDERNPIDASYECENADCRHHWTDAERIEAICGGYWKATAPFNGVRGRYLNGLYRVIGKKDCHQTYFQEFVVEYLAAKEKGEEALIVWENTFRARAYQIKFETMEIQPLLDRRETYGAQVPAGVLLLTAGADVHPDRIECSTWGWGDGEESWLIEHRVFTGNTTEEFVWTSLRDYLQSEFTHANGVRLRIICTMVDSGHNTNDVYRFTRKMERYGIYACKGSKDRYAPLCPAVPARNNALRAARYDVGVHAAKNQLFYRLRVGMGDSTVRGGPRYVHFPLGEARGCDLVYFEQLTAERLIGKRVDGHVIKVWEIPEGDDRRNETLDCAVYASAAVFRLRPNWAKLKERMELEAKHVNKAPEPLIEKQPEEKPIEAKPNGKPQFRPPRRQGNRSFVSKWR